MLPEIEVRTSPEYTVFYFEVESILGGKEEIVFGNDEEKISFQAYVRRDAKIVATHAIKGKFLESDAMLKQLFWMSPFGITQYSADFQTPLVARGSVDNLIEIEPSFDERYCEDLKLRGFMKNVRQLNANLVEAFLIEAYQKLKSPLFLNPGNNELENQSG